MLWLQLHFDDRHWEALAAGKVELDGTTVEPFLNDCRAAGIVVGGGHPVAPPANCRNQRHQQP